MNSAKIFNTIKGHIFKKLNGDGINARAARGSLVLVAGMTVERTLRLVRNIILARLIVPREFGLTAIVLASTEAFDAIAAVGVKESIIHSKIGNETRYLNVAWWFQAIRGMCLFAVAYFLSPYVSQFYGNPQLSTLMRVAFVALLFKSMISPRAHAFEKNIRYSRLVLLTQSSGFIGTLLTLILAFFVSRSAWILVIGYVAESVSQCLLSFVLCPFRPRMSVDRESIRSILNYARGMLGLSFLTMVSMQADIFVLGKVISKEELGLYAMALALAQQVSQFLFGVIGRVMLPVFAAKQDDKQVLRNAVMRTIKASVIIGAPLVILLSVFSRQILTLIYRPDYTVMALPFTLLCGTLLIRIQSCMLANVNLAIGKPYLHRRYIVLLVLLIVTMIYPVTILWGPKGTTSVLLLSYSISICMQVIWMKPVIGFGLRDYLLCWIPWVDSMSISTKQTQSNNIAETQNC